MLRPESSVSVSSPSIIRQRRREAAAWPTVEAKQPYTPIIHSRVDASGRIVALSADGGGGCHDRLASWQPPRLETSSGAADDAVRLRCEFVGVGLAEVNRGVLELADELEGVEHGLGAVRGHQAIRE